MEDLCGSWPDQVHEASQWLAADLYSRAALSSSWGSEPCGRARPAMESWAWLMLLADLNEVVTLAEVGSAEMTLFSKLDVSASNTKQVKLLL